MPSSRFMRLLAPIAVGAAIASGIAGCGGGNSGQSGAQSTALSAEAKAIDALKYIGDGLKADYIKKVDAASTQESKDAIVEEATRISDVVGTPMAPIDLIGDMGKSQFMLNEDGTVTATHEVFHAMMSNATHWRVGDRTMDLCTDESCEFYSSWDITYSPNEGVPPHYRFTINTNGVEPDDAENYRDLLIKE
ncbi:hypothetical protein [Schaalia vaccimaxillae]|uniref:hypothetical protein n=1 Tax=Schaalia vaccimaxillae TaxID=183916 RepID=UPI0003B58C73|nr:hypothetical protein [Schaalia vaccimaxillae]